MRLDVTVEVEDKALRRALGNLVTRTPAEVEAIARTLAGLGREWARDIITIAIYATPQRGGYQRTRYLLRSIYGAVDRINSEYRVTVGAAANYTAANELGTYDASVAPEEVLEAARAAASDLIVLEYGRPERGLEPRPFIIPALVMMERELPELVIRAYRRLVEHGV